MKPQAHLHIENSGEHPEGTPEDDLWFLPGPLEAEPDFLPPELPRDPTEAEILAEWVTAQANHAARLARAASRLGALSERLSRAPDGWRRRMALIEVANLSWLDGEPIGVGRLALYMSMRLTGIQEDADALSRAGWAVRRMTDGPDPEHDLGGFLGRRDPAMIAEDAERFSDHAGAWMELMAAASDLHPIARACMGFHVWGLAGLNRYPGGTMEAAVTAARVAVSDQKSMKFAPLAMAGVNGLRAVGTPTERLGRWLDGMDGAALASMRRLDDIAAWADRAEHAMSMLSGRTPPALLTVLAEWPLISAPMAEALTGASREAVRRNLAWMEARDLIREVTGQGRYRMWRAAVARRERRKRPFSADRLRQAPDKWAVDV